jgi:predicted hydrocarbon binding protein
MSFFEELLKIGRIKLEGGNIIIFNATDILLPTRVLIYLAKLLAKKYGSEESANILKELGRFQIKQAAVRYKKLLGIEKVEKRQLMEFGQRLMELLGLGILKFSTPYKIIIRNNPIAVEHSLMFGKSKEPVDFYLTGIVEEMCKAFWGKEFKVRESKCIACGDPSCEFEILPIGPKK